MTRAKIKSSMLREELEAQNEELQAQNEELRVLQLEHARSQLRYQDLYDFAPTAYLTLDHAGKIIECNQSAAKLLDLPQSQVRGRRLASFLNDTMLFHEARRRAVRKRTSCEVTLRKGTPVQLEMLVGSGGEGVQCALLDLSEVRSYQAKLRQMAYDATLREERERRAIAADLHDRIGQTLTAAQMKLAAARPGANGDMRATLEETEQLLQQCIVDTRTLTFEICPPILYDLGMSAALEWLGEQMGELYGLRVELRRKPAIPKLGDDVAAVVFRCVRELLVNVAKHAKTNSATLTLASDDDLRIVVADRGCGFPEKNGHTGFGLFGVREHLAHIGGSLEIVSGRRGTTAEIMVPRIS